MIQYNDKSNTKCGKYAALGRLYQVESLALISIGFLVFFFSFGEIIDWQMDNDHSDESNINSDKCVVLGTFSFVESLALVFLVLLYFLW